MKDIKELIKSEYTKHYLRTNITLNPSELREAFFKEMENMYGRFITSLPEGTKVLDIGCGAGLLLYWLSKHGNIEPIGIDNSPSQVKLAKKINPDIKIFLEDGIKFLESTEIKFGGIFSIDLLEHIDGLENCIDFIKAAQNALTDDGFFLCRVPNAANLMASYSRYMDITHERLFTSKSILQLLEMGGFDRCELIPFKPHNVTGVVRKSIETLLHKAIFMICARSDENYFSRNLYAIGNKSGN